MAKKLLIVESPAKAKTIGKYLGKDFSVKASVGHVKDLPVSKLGVDLEKEFEPTYEVIKGKKKVIDELKKAAEGAEAVFLATDPDREGEAIAWHIAEEIRGKAKPKKSKKAAASTTPVHRVLFHEITKRSVQEALKNPLELNQKLFEAQQARRVLDRLVGYQISPLLWDKVQRGLSAGRVQSVAVRLICEREEEISKFKSEEYWSIETRLEGSNPPIFSAKLLAQAGKKLEISNQAEADGLKTALEKSSFLLKEILRKERRRNPYPPFITSTLQQDASRKLGFTAKKTMMLAQRLYEGVELGGDAVGLITYMRTDSTRLSPDALNQVREYIAKQYGKEFLPDQANIYKTKKAAQDAHEAIRPTSTEYDPESVKQYLEPDQYKLYDLIWKRFVACQMNPAIYDQTTFNITAADYELRATGSVVKFAGFLSVYQESRDEGAAAEEDDEQKTLPNLKEGESLKLHEILPEQHFTQPPPRFTEASLVKELEEKGIGRPSTYAAILSTIQDKKYASKDAGRFHPTELGKVVNKLLVENFPEILNVTFTAQMENELDEVEEGNLAWTKALSDFYTPFEKTLAHAKVKMKNLKKQEIATEFTCEKCGKPMVIKWGRHGEFMACSGYPECKSTKEIARGEGGKIMPQEQPTTDEVCEKCSAPMVVKRGRFGSFLACSKYPECKSTKAIPIGVNCPECSSALSERRSKRGKVFYGCTGYPKCTFALWDKPINETCPQCNAKYLVVKYSKKDGEKIKCASKECGYEKESA